MARVTSKPPTASPTVRSTSTAAASVTTMNNSDMPEHSDAAIVESLPSRSLYNQYRAAMERQAAMEHEAAIAAARPDKPEPYGSERPERLASLLENFRLTKPSIALANQSGDTPSRTLPPRHLGQPNLPPQLPPWNAKPARDATRAIHRARQVEPYMLEGMLPMIKDLRQSCPNEQFYRELLGEIGVPAATIDTLIEDMAKIHQVPPQQAPVQMARDMNPEDFTKPYTDFMTANPTVFHATAAFRDDLLKADYTELSSRDNWAGQLKPGGKYFTTRNGSSIIAFAVGKAYQPGNGVAMIAGHIDALTARLKPVSTKPNNHGYVQLGIAQYAGALNSTWWDRDLSIGGRVIVRDPETGKTNVKLVKLDWPIARIPTLAPHFGLSMTGHNNQETEMVPIVGLDNSDLSSSSPTTNNTPLGGAGSFTAKQPPKLVKLIAGELGIADYSAIVNWELELFDSQPATVGGMDKEFIFAGRIDDKLCSWAAFMALLHATHGEDEGTIKLVALFDDEEIGSLLRQGARGNFLPMTIERAVESLCGSSNKIAFGPGVIGQTYARSFLVSSDVTHAAHPNFPQTNLEGHSPRLNVGVALCVDASAHMTTDSVSTAILDRVAHLSGTVNQTHMIRNDSRSGGTVGPMLSSAMGVKAADVGIPQLSMHSIRATTGALDPGLGVKFYKGFLDHWEEVDKEWVSSE